jgi:internalin A
VEGVLEHRRLRQIWYDHGIAGRERYDPRLHPFFLRLMEKFDVSYRLEDVPDSSLVAQLVPEVQPDLPWHLDKPLDPADERAELRLVCQMKQSPPGLVPWMIVRTHRFTTGKYWQRGVFLAHLPHGQAVLELRETQLNVELRITVRAGYPSHFLSVLQDMLTYLIEQCWPGLEYRLAVPCPSRLDDRACEGRFDLDALRDFKREGDETIRCQDCRQRQYIDKLLVGFEPPSIDLRARLDELQASVDTARREQREYASHAAQLARITLKAMSSETRDCPRLFTLLPEDLGIIDRLVFGKTGMRLTLWCERPDQEHPVCVIGSGGVGEWVIKQPKGWLVKIAPYAKMVATLLGATVPIAADIAKVAVDPKLLEDLEGKIDLMQTLTDKLLEVGKELGELSSHDLVHRELDEPYSLMHTAEGAELRQLYSLLLD